MHTIFFLYYTNQGYANGVNTYARSMIKAAKEITSKNMHFFFVEQDCELHSAGGYRKKKRNGITYITLPTIKSKVPLSKKQYLEYCNIVSDFLEEDIRNVTNPVVHLNWIDQLPLAQVLKEKFGCKIVFTRHSVPWQSIMVANYDLFLKILNNNRFPPEAENIKPILIFEKVYYQFVDQIIAVTKHSKEDLVKRYLINESKISVVYNGIKTVMQTSRNKNDLRRKYGFRQDEKLLLFVGREEKLPGLKLFIDNIMALLQDDKNPIRIIIAGCFPTTDFFEDKLFTSHYCLMGEVDEMIISDLYILSDVGIIPSLYEECSFVALEMLAAKLPVLCSNAGGLDEIIKHKLNGYKFPVCFGPEKYFFEKDKCISALVLSLQHSSKGFDGYNTFEIDNSFIKTIGVYKTCYSAMYYNLYGKR